MGYVILTRPEVAHLYSRFGPEVIFVIEESQTPMPSSAPRSKVSSTAEPSVSHHTSLCHFPKRQQKKKWLTSREQGESRVPGGAGDRGSRER